MSQDIHDFLEAAIGVKTSGPSGEYVACCAKYFCALRLADRGRKPTVRMQVLYQERKLETEIYTPRGEILMMKDQLSMNLDNSPTEPSKRVLPVPQTELNCRLSST